MDYTVYIMHQIKSYFEQHFKILLEFFHINECSIWDISQQSICDRASDLCVLLSQWIFDSSVSPLLPSLSHLVVKYYSLKPGDHRPGFYKCIKRSKVATAGFIFFLPPKEHGKEMYFLLKSEEYGGCKCYPTILG